MQQIKNKLKVDKNSSIPLYKQLEKIITEEIKNGHLRPGDKIPSEHQLCRNYGVSRITVRKSLANLSAKGLIHRRQGSGTFVNHLGARNIKALVSEKEWIWPLVKATEIYNKENPHQPVKLEAEAVGKPTLRSEIVEAVACGEAPDLALIDWAWMTELADLHYLKPLEELDEGWVEEYKRDLFPIFVERNSYQGRLYGVQTEANVCVLWYRKDLLEKEKLKPPETWDELVQAATHFKKQKRRSKYGLSRFPLAFHAGACAGETTTFELLSFIWSAGGKLNIEGETILDPKAVSSFRFLKDLVHKYQVAPFDVLSYKWNDPAILFARGEVVFALGGSYEKSLIEDVSGWTKDRFREKVGFLPVPAGPGGKQATTAGGMVYTIFRQSAHQKASLQILKQVASSTLMREFCRQTGRKPTRVSVVDSLHPELDWFAYRLAKLLDVANVRPSIPEYPKISSQLQHMLESIISEKKTVEEAVGNAQQTIEFLTSWS